MTTQILDLNEAAQYLKMSPGALRRKAAAGVIPGAKPGKRWCFRQDDLVEYIRSLYSEPAKALLGDHIRRNQWHSTKDIMCGGLTSLTQEKEYNDLLGLRTK